MRAFIMSCHESSDPEKQNLAKEWNDFMLRFGRRGPGEIDIAVPRYEHRPVLVLAMVFNPVLMDTKMKTKEIVNVKLQYRASYQNYRNVIIRR